MGGETVFTTITRPGPTLIHGRVERVVVKQLGLRVSGLAHLVRSPDVLWPGLPSRTFALPRDSASVLVVQRSTNRILSMAPLRLPIQALMLLHVAHGNAIVEKLPALIPLYQYRYYYQLVFLEPHAPLPALVC
ncbi:predicted protein [Pyrenophora tritici-repentis Pt-1C-BFP]|uniref:Uncharacterized protein n=1 Tax=Pyrenophora tritici-repentis (strain Pt-1C-BFP) TaxID=426418 RepID=B2WDT7_PYRTR|nr:uncharacterized protein PTRG_08310 [Pyrenophora tritici-repentis Pt-1C-BFP]EDU51229.1 predicted protein [Pyrenophora tritici-repentis Pt-1C-BFP]